ncbi:uncharacterized protein LOC132759238 [Ruditapes philippinarum]|uniref:uncharacterized protein LOC132759238 n=1 Tax=Ruditapes philippinarum TaxID=129788 RepID=UPI00295C346F|nr:uncharacterized protein LOC132759238 [Ruditapes philippinarum]
MKPLTGIVFILYCSLPLQRTTATKNDDRDMFEALIKTLIEDERSEVNAISGGQAHESEDVQRAYGNKDNDEGLIRAIEVFLQSKRAREWDDKKRWLNADREQADYERQWITADAAYKGTNTGSTTKSTTITTVPTSTTTVPPSTTTAPRRRYCFWVWSRRYCF